MMRGYWRATRLRVQRGGSHAPSQDDRICAHDHHVGSLFDVLFDCKACPSPQGRQNLSVVIFIESRVQKPLRELRYVVDLDREPVFFRLREKQKWTHKHASGVTAMGGLLVDDFRNCLVRYLGV